MRDVLALLVLLAIICLEPCLTIWSINTLAGSTVVPLTIWTWASLVWLSMVLTGAWNTRVAESFEKLTKKKDQARAEVTKQLLDEMLKGDTPTH